MLNERINLWDEGEYHYSMAFGFQPNLRAYLHEDAQKRPCVLVIPGGGYQMLAPTEGENVAKWFYHKGYQAFVGSYTTNLLKLEPLKQQPLLDISRMVRMIRKQADRFHIHPDQIILCGFSAGGHLCGSLCVHWKDVKDNLYPDVSNRPNGAILAYPLITSGEYSHGDTIAALLGNTPSQEELNYISLEKQVSADTPPIFLWQTAADELVPVENSFLMALALQRNGIPLEYHVFPRGAHGLSLSNHENEEIQMNALYTLEQMLCFAQAVKDGKIAVPSQTIAYFSRMLENPDDQGRKMVTPVAPVPEVSVWPQMADRFIRSICFENNVNTKKEDSYGC